MFHISFQWASKKFRSLTALICHEQINMEDRFGQVMLDNLNQRGCALIGASVCKNKDTQVCFYSVYTILYWLKISDFKMKRSAFCFANPCIIILNGLQELRMVACSWCYQRIQILRSNEGWIIILRWLSLQGPVL